MSITHSDLFKMYTVCFQVTTGATNERMTKYHYFRDTQSYFGLKGNNLFERSDRSYVQKPKRCDTSQKCCSEWLKVIKNQLESENGLQVTTIDAKFKSVPSIPCSYPLSKVLYS